MTTLKARITEDMKTAMKAGDKLRLSVVRMLMSELKNEKIAKGAELDEATERRVLTSYAKKRKEAMDAARAVKQALASARQRTGNNNVLLHVDPAALNPADIKPEEKVDAEETGTVMSRPSSAA